MSPRQFGKADESIGWPNLPCCPHRHRASTPCPPTDVWLLPVLCHRCKPGQYCGYHGGRRQVEPMPAAATADVRLEQAVVAHRYEREEGEG